MNSTEQLNQLELTLVALKARFAREATYSEEKLQHLIELAKKAHVPTQTFPCAGARDMASLLQEKFRLGFTYQDCVGAAWVLPSHDIAVQLLKPPEIITAEYAALELEVREHYQSSIDAIRPVLIAEIASVQLELKELQANLKAQVKREAEYQKMLASVQHELCPDGDTQQSNSMDTAPAAEFGENLNDKGN